MDVETQIRAWKDAKFRSTVSSEELLPNPAGLRLAEVDEGELRALWGAAAATGDVAQMPSQGYVCSVSGECNGGTSCWSVIAS